MTHEERTQVSEVAGQSWDKPDSLKSLFIQVCTSAQEGRKRDLLQDATWFLELAKINVRANAAHEKPSDSVPLIITPNHFSRRVFFTTGESFNTVTLVTKACKTAGVTERHTAWFIKKLPIKRFVPIQLPRMVQNAAVITYSAIPVEVSPRGIENKQEMIAKYLTAKDNGYNIGFFPEQTPSRRLRVYHADYPKFIGFMQTMYPERFQILPVSVYFEDDHTAVANFGRVISVEKNDQPNDVASATMQEIASNLPLVFR